MWIKEFQGNEGHVILVHGLGEHAKRYQWLVDLLIPRFGVTLFDLPGHGESEGKRGHASFSEIFNIIDELVSRHPGCFLMGHSLGGLIAIRYVELRNNVKGLIVTSPALHLPNSNIALRTVASIFSILAPALTFDNGINPNDLSTNPEAVQKYVADPLVHRRISARLAADLFKHSQMALKEAHRIKVPTFVAVGSEDRVTLPTGARQFFENLTVKDRVLKVYQGSYHELFEDSYNAEVFKLDLLSWLNSHR
ncbi:lysophospholipase [Pseudothermotoga hypogea DSM 11164 = NBRC 106472]|uniref:Lysophospholipase n=2 Tax=Pseudothermotoga hypogea TaxID=57487 RepID=A0A0X1KTK2_9THEM|nr:MULTISPECIES: alpha/beta hydrolase [Pseudothermotoga]AJC74553.1 lysophospholipase [Pseudothermotoga hypogea DSM 11164 = NBRC 106472]MDI6862131.1 lysophospholipase [Pseudothermotoga sp.]